MAEQAFERGWGMATIPTTSCGLCCHSRETPLKTFDCTLEKNMKAWDPMLFPGKKFKTHTACKYQDDMRRCGEFTEQVKRS